MEASFYQNLTASIFYRCFHAMKAFLLLLFISLLSLHNSVEHSEICGNFANPDSYLCWESLLPEGYYVALRYIVYQEPLSVAVFQLQRNNLMIYLIL